MARDGTFREDLENQLLLFRAAMRRVLPKPGKASLKDMLLARSDLPPGDWTRGLDCFVRMSLRKDAGEEAIRAVEAKGIAGKRVWRPLLWKGIASDIAVLVKIAFFATAQDAQGYARRQIDQVLWKPVSRREHVFAGYVSGSEVSALSECSALYEYRYRLDGADACERLVSGHVERVVFLMAVYRRGTPRDWDEVASIVDRQKARIRSVLAKQPFTT